MHAHGLRGVADLAEVEFFGHRHKRIVDRPGRRGHHRDRPRVRSAVVARKIVALPDAPGALGREARVVAHVPVDDLPRPVTVLQPVGEGEDLVCRSGGEPGRAAVCPVGAEVNGRRGRPATVFGVVEALVLRHDEDAPGAHLHRRRGAAKCQACFVRRSVRADLRLRVVLLAQVQGCVDAVAAPLPVACALLGSVAESFQVPDVLHDEIAEVLGV